ncbi:MAG: YitT family protein, partial [Heliobacteriaceae bacterium]|nr:YitT family protein [Heliobacteriaceae bacterium]
SIITSYLTNFPLGMLIFGFNLPFLVLGYIRIGKRFVASTLFSIVILAVGVSILRPFPGVTGDMLLAAVFGGIILGLGVGLIIRFGGSLDGTEIVAIIMSKRAGFSVGEVIMFFNIFILSSAGFFLGWDKAMYSLIAYFIAFKTIDLTIQGLDDTKEVKIISDKSEIIAEALIERLGLGVTFLKGKGGYSGEAKPVLYSLISRFEIGELKSIIDEIDENAFVTVSNINEVMGGVFKKKSMH